MTLLDIVLVLFLLCVFCVVFAFAIVGVFFVFSFKDEIINSIEDNDII